MDTLNKPLPEETEETPVLPELEEELLPPVQEEEIIEEMEDLFALPEETEEAVETVPEVAPVPTQPAPPVPQKPKRKRNIRGALLFICTVLGMALCILSLFCFAAKPIRAFLEEYELSQPQYARDAIYDMLFADPDWALLYDLAGVKPTDYEGRDAYVSYMETKIGDRELTCTETAAGLSGSRRYLLRCDGELIAAFTMDNHREGWYDNWTFSGVEVFFTREESVTVVLEPDHTVYINGVALDDSFTTLSLDTAAEDILPDGVHAYRWKQQELTGLLVPPQVVVLDEYNNPVPVTYSEETGIYSTEIPTTPKITDKEKALVVDAAKAQALYAIRKINLSQLRQHFDANTETYKKLCDADPFVKSFKSYKFNEDSITVTDFYRYNDNLFSARVTLELDITVKWKNYKTYKIDATYFFTRNNGDHYLVTDVMDTDLLAQRTYVRLNYMQDDVLLHTEMVRNNVKSLTAPEALNETGSAPIAWGIPAEDGTMTVILTAGEDGTFLLAEGQTLSAMTLYPIYEEVATE